MPPAVAAVEVIAARRGQLSEPYRGPLSGRWISGGEPVIDAGGRVPGRARPVGRPRQFSTRRAAGGRWRRDAGGAGRTQGIAAKRRIADAGREGGPDRRTGGSSCATATPSDGLQTGWIASSASPRCRAPTGRSSPAFRWSGVRQGTPESSLHSVCCWCWHQHPGGLPTFISRIAGHRASDHHHRTDWQAVAAGNLDARREPARTEIAWWRASSNAMLDGASNPSVRWNACWPRNARCGPEAEPPTDLVALRDDRRQVASRTLSLGAQTPANSNPFPARSPTTCARPLRDPYGRRPLGDEFGEHHGLARHAAAHRRGGAAHG